MTTASHTICSPWASLPDLPTDRPKLPNKNATDEQSDDVYEQLLWTASEMLFAFTARQFTGVCESTVELREHHDERGGWVADGVFGGGVPGGATVAGSMAGVVYPGLSGLGWRGRRAALVAALPGAPIVELLEVTLDGEPLTVEADLQAGLIWRRDGRGWPVDGSVLVTYRHGARPPAGGVQAAKTLAVELGKALDGRDCALPQRVQTLTRQGVTVGFRDAFESLDSLRTGIWSIDAFIQSVNPAKLKARPSVHSPDAARARRRVVGP